MAKKSVATLRTDKSDKVTRVVQFYKNAPDQSYRVREAVVKTERIEDYIAEKKS